MSGAVCFLATLFAHLAISNLYLSLTGVPVPILAVVPVDSFLVSP
jgi:hypothetical protein